MVVVSSVMPPSSTVRRVLGVVAAMRGSRPSRAVLGQHSGNEAALDQAVNTVLELRHRANKGPFQVGGGSTGSWGRQGPRLHQGQGWGDHLAPGARLPRPPANRVVRRHQSVQYHLEVTHVAPQRSICAPCWVLLFELHQLTLDVGKLQGCSSGGRGGRCAAVHPTALTLQVPSRHGDSGPGGAAGAPGRGRVGGGWHRDPTPSTPATYPRLA